MSDKKENSWYAGGLHFECIQCGRCCQGPDEGYIWVTKREIELIAENLQISVEDLYRQYLQRVMLRTTIIEDHKTNDCIFLENRKKCRIYPVRPNQCRTWPFWRANLISPNAWNQAAQRCPGINRGRLYSLEEIRKIKNQKSW